MSTNKTGKYDHMTEEELEMAAYLAGKLAVRKLAKFHGEEGWTQMMNQRLDATHQEAVRRFEERCRKSG